MKKQQATTEQLENLKKELEEWKGKYLRALADYQNLEKRIAITRSEDAKYAAQKIIHELLIVYDTLEKTEKHLNDQGLKLGIQGFHAVLTANGVKKIDVLGKQFDPHTMECVEVVESDKDDEVVEEVRSGYLLDDKLLRAARVKVGKKREEKEKKSEEFIKQ